MSLFSYLNKVEYPLINFSFENFVRRVTLLYTFLNVNSVYKCP